MASWPFCNFCNRSSNYEGANPSWSRCVWELLAAYNVSSKQLSFTRTANSRLKACESQFLTSSKKKKKKIEGTSKRSIPSKSQCVWCAAEVRTVWLKAQWVSPSCYFSTCSRCLSSRWDNGLIILTIWNISVKEIKDIVTWLEKIARQTSLFIERRGRLNNRVIAW